MNSVQLDEQLNIARANAGDGYARASIVNEDKTEVVIQVPLPGDDGAKLYRKNLNSGKWTEL